MTHVIITIENSSPNMATSQTSGTEGAKARGTLTKQVHASIVESAR